MKIWTDQILLIQIHVHKKWFTLSIKPIKSELDGQMKLNQFAAGFKVPGTIRGLVRDRATNKGDAVLVPKRRGVEHGS